MQSDLINGQAKNPRRWLAVCAWCMAAVTLTAAGAVVLTGFFSPERESGHAAGVASAQTTAKSPQSPPAAAPKAAPIAAPISTPMGEVAFAPLVDWSHARAVYRIVENWVLDASYNIKENKQPIRVAGVAGVRVTLRRGGLTVGVGDAYLPELAIGPASKLIKNEDDLGPTCDLVALSRVATQKALMELGEELARVRAAAEKKSHGTPATKGQGLSDVVQFLTVDVQVARLPKAIFISPLADENAVFDTFAPGFHGLRLVRTDQPELAIQSWVWPASSIASNFTPRTQLLILLNHVNLDEKKLPMLGRNEPAPPAAARAPNLKAVAPLGKEANKPAATTAPADPPAGLGGQVLPAVLERFEVIHIARGNNIAPELSLTRGNIVLPPASLDEATLRALGERLAGHLVHRIRADGMMVGTYEPTSDCFEPVLASDEEVGLTTLALSRWAKYLARRDAGNPQQIKVDNAILAAVNFARDRVRGNPPAGPSVAATVLCTLMTAPHLSDNKGKRDEMLSVVLACRKEDGSFREGPKSDKLLSVNGQAMMTCAMAAVYAQNADPKLGAQARQSLELLWRDVDLGRALAALPWMMAAEFDLQKCPAPPAAAADPAPIPRAQAIAIVMGVLRDRQIAGAPNLGPADVVGGFELTPSRPDVPPNPDWKSAFALDFLARSMIFPGAVARKERLTWVLNCSLAARFLAQLSFDEPSCFYVRSHSDAMGGLRTSLWDNRLFATPSAVSLVAITDLLEALAVIQEQGGLAAE